MPFFERLGELAKGLFTAELQLKHLQDAQDGLQDDVKRLAEDLHDLRERVARIEAFREADRAEIQADLSRFKSEVERAAMRLLRPDQPEPPALP